MTGHGRASVSSSTSPVAQSTIGVGRSTFNVGGSRPCRIASTILMAPMTPAAAPGWPKLDFTEPSHSGRSAGRPWPYVRSRASASIGSPRRVPVPCASTASTSAGESRPLLSAARMTRRWDGPFGAVRPLDAPSWLTAEPRTTASTW